MPASSRRVGTGQFGGVLLIVKLYVACCREWELVASDLQQDYSVQRQQTLLIALCAQEFINLHVDECLRRQEVAVSNPSGAGRSNGMAAAGKANGGGRRGAAKKLEVPPKLAAHLLSDRQLKEQLKRYELPAIGKKEVRRH